MIKKSGAGKGQIDLISIKKFVIGLASFLAPFLLLNWDALKALLSQYIANPQWLALIAPFVLYILEQFNHDYSKKK